MSCGELVSGGKVVGHICWPDGSWQRVPGRRRKRWWCFHCRKHLTHTLMWFIPSGPSYYGPSPPQWECPQCHQEHVLFPGQEWGYDE